MSSEPPQTQETLPPSLEGAIAEAIAEAQLLLTSLEDQVKLGFFTAQAETKIAPSDEQPLLPEHDIRLTDWL